MSKPIPRLIKLYACMALLSWPSITGLLNPWYHSAYPEAPRQSQAEYLGVSVVFGALGTIAWPILLPVTFCITGFGSCGWSLRILPTEGEL